MMNKLQGGGFSHPFAKFVASESHALLTDMSDKIDVTSLEFAPERLQLFRSEDPESGEHTPQNPGASKPEPPPILKHVLHILNECSTTLKDRLGVLGSTMASKPNWGGAMAKLEYNLQWEEWPLGGAELSGGYPEHQDSPWLACCLQFTYRCGPAVYHLAGIRRGCCCCHRAVCASILQFGGQTLCRCTWAARA